MIGYACSVDLNKSLSDITIRVLPDTLAHLAFSQDALAVFKVNRFSLNVKTIKAPSGFNISDEIIEKIFVLLRCEEIKIGMPVNIMWTLNEEGKAFLNKTDIMHDVFFLTDIFKRNDRVNLLNVTKAFSDNDMKTLKSTFICDILNLTLSMLCFKISSPFISYGKNIFITFEFIKIINHTFGFDIFKYMMDKNSFKFDKDTTRAISKEPYYKISKNKLKGLVSKVEFDSERGIGLAFSDFGLKVKRECVKSIINSIKETLSYDYDFTYLLNKINHHIKEALLNYHTLSELFLAKGHIYALNDINYLTYYKLLECFSFSQNELDMKKEINFEKEKYRIIKNQKTPDVILTKNNNLIYK